MKMFITMVACIVTVGIKAQVGINTDAPEATLQVVGKPLDVNAMDGIIAPRISGDQLTSKTYGADQIGALVFVNQEVTPPPVFCSNYFSYRSGILLF